MKAIDFHSALDFGYDVLAEAFYASFEGYVVTMKFDPAGLEARARAESWDLSSSFLAYRSDELAGVLFVSRRGARARVAGMAVTPTQRRTGVGRAMIDRFLSEARARGDQRLTLEVLENNPAAIALYESSGFHRDRRLVGWDHAGLPGGAHTSELEEMELSDFAESAYAAQEPNLPWQFHAATLANLTLPWRAFRLGDHARAVLMELSPDHLMLRAIVVPHEHRRQGHATTLLAQLSALFPAHSWSIPSALPEGVAEPFLRSLGFTRAPLSQWEMSVRGRDP